MNIVLSYLVPGLWIALFVVWGIEALRSKQTQQREQASSRSIHLGLMLLSFFLTLMPTIKLGPLNAHILPETLPFALLGCLIEALGLGFAIAARHYLGQNWSGTITTKRDHTLIQSGPYALARHPIYTGWLVGLLGAALAYGEWRSLIGVAVMLAALIRKITIEEGYLVRQFGIEYNQYRQKVKALVPFVW